MQYFYDAYLKNLGPTVVFARIICALPGGQRLMGKIIKKSLIKHALTEHGTVHFIKDNVEDHIDAYWGNKKSYEALPDKLSQMKHYTDWDYVAKIDHGYDETKPETELNINDIKQAASFRGGECLSSIMTKGDLKSKLDFKCAFGHSFKASPRLILEGGHWCPECERKSWNYGERAKKDKFFAQVWNPLHDKNETREYPKTVSDLDI